MELETQVQLSADLGFLKDGDMLHQRTNKTYALLNGLMASLQSGGERDKR